MAHLKPRDGFIHVSSQRWFELMGNSAQMKYFYLRVSELSGPFLYHFDVKDYYNPVLTVHIMYASYTLISISLWLWGSEEAFKTSGFQSLYEGCWIFFPVDIAVWFWFTEISNTLLVSTAWGRGGLSVSWTVKCPPSPWACVEFSPSTSHFYPFSVMSMLLIALTCKWRFLLGELVSHVTIFGEGSDILVTLRGENPPHFGWARGGFFPPVLPSASFSL